MDRRRRNNGQSVPGLSEKGGLDSSEFEAEFQRVWERWLAERNRRASRIMSFLALSLFPFFWLLDILVVEGAEFWTFGALRLTVCIHAIWVLLALRTAWGQRHGWLLAALSAWVPAWSITIMVALLGGPESPYYAGINLVMVGSTLLALYGRRGTLVVYGTVLGGWFVLLPFQLEAATLTDAINNTFFVSAMGVLVIVGQFFMYASYRDQIRSNLALELTRSSLERAHEDLKQLDRFKSQVFANITHELKTPMAMILSPLELMLTGDMGPFTPQQQNSLQTMFKSGLGLLRLIQDLLDLSKLQESRIRLDVTECNLVVYLQELIDQVRPLTSRKGIELTFTTQLPHCLVWCDLERIERVFINLLSNASKFTREGGQINVVLNEDEERATVSVVDTGAGFDPALAEQIFDRFFQIEGGSRRRHGGAGIGLALAKDLVELHNGEIWATSRPGHGSRFHVRLRKGRSHFDPDVLERRARTKDVLHGRRAADQGIAEWAGPLLHREDYRFLDIATATERRVIDRDPDENQRAHTVLVVEDNPDVIRVIHLALRQSFKVVAAQDGIQGLEMAERIQPDLVISDLMMPGIDGLELTQRLRDDPRTQHLPIIMLTARGDMDDRLAGIETGVNAYLTKPFSPRELVTTVRSLLDIQRTAAGLLLERSMDSLGHLTSGLAHEINNPLNYIRNAFTVLDRQVKSVVAMLGELQGEALSEGHLEQLKSSESRIQKMRIAAEAGVERIHEIVKLMAQYSQEGYQRVFRRHDVFEATRRVVSVVRSIVARDVSVEEQFDGDGHVECVPQELNQALTNLIQNAIEAVPDDTGVVRVTGRRESDTVSLKIWDNGTGMSAEVRDRIFTPFFTTKSPGHGMGLGLTITWRVVTSMGGHIELDTVEGEYTCFTLIMPIAQAGRGLGSASPDPPDDLTAESRH